MRGASPLKNHIVKLPFIIALAILAGCATKKAAEPEAAPAADTSSQVVDATPAASADAEDANALRTTIYFDYDSSDVRDQYRAELLAVAAALSKDPRLAARLEGHTDSRGSREYNVGLGERRAQAVKRFLLLNGVAQGQLATISYGEERPAAEGDSEGAWSRNRRVEIVRTP